MLHNGRRPHRTPGPRHRVGVQNAAVLRPVHQIGRRKCVQKNLLVIGCGVGRINPETLAENRALRVGIPTGKDRVAGMRLRGCAMARSSMTTRHYADRQNHSAQTRGPFCRYDHPVHTASLAIPEGFVSPSLESLRVWNLMALKRVRQPPPMAQAVADAAFFHQPMSEVVVDH